MIRGIFTSVVEGLIKRFSATGRCDETFENREYFQHYGFTSRPVAGAETIIIQRGNNIIAIASDDRRYRIAMGEGEVALYDDQGQKVHLRDGGNVEVVAIAKAKVTAPVIELVASTKITCTTPLLEVSGNITAGGNISDASGTKSMLGMRQVFDAHTHSHPADGVTIPAPGTKMG